VSLFPEAKARAGTGGTQGGGSWPTRPSIQGVGHLINELGLALVRQALEMPGHHDARTFELLDLMWEKHSAVFGNADHMWPTAYFTSCLPIREGASFLEMGCGVGVTAVVAALSGCDPVTALDINPAAVRNTVANARRHGVGDRIRAVCSNLFEALDPDEKFDIIYWNSPFVETPADTALKSFDDYALFDPGYSTHWAFLRAAPEHLTEQGRIFLGFSTAAGNLDHIQEIATEVGMKAVIFQQEAAEVRHEEVGTAPEFAAHADSMGMIRLDITLLELVNR
jgi:release factor glutamine methyltransferase